MTNEVAIINLLVRLTKKQVKRHGGIHVRMSSEGRRKLLNPWSRRTSRFGELVGICHNKELVRVVLRGQKTASSYHPSFWEIV